MNDETLIYLGIIAGFAVLCLLVWVWYKISTWFYNAAVDKGYDDTKYLWLTFWLGAVGMFLVIALPDKKLRYVIGNSSVNGTATTTVEDEELPEL